MATLVDRILDLIVALRTTINQRGLPAGGTSGQVLAKNSAAPRDVVWVPPGASSLPVGTEGQVVGYGSGGVAGAVWPLSRVKSRGLSTEYVNGTGGSLTSNSSWSNVIQFTPIHLDRARTWTRIGTRLGAYTSGTRNVRFGIYSDVNNRPGVLIKDSGIVAISGPNNTNFEAIISQFLEAGHYWLALFSDAGGVMSHSAINAGETMQPRNANLAVTYGYSRALAFAALPSDETTSSLSVSSITPVIYLRIA